MKTNLIYEVILYCLESDNPEFYPRKWVFSTKTKANRHMKMLKSNISEMDIEGIIDVQLQEVEVN